MPVVLADDRAGFPRPPAGGDRSPAPYGTMSFVVRKALLGRLRDDDTVFAMRCEPDERDFLIEIEPEVFFTTDHYRGYGYVLIRLAETDAERLAPLVERAWRHGGAEAPRRRA